ncbi:hypothetical protein RQM65_13660 [Pricia sp. S334]|uniref:Four helix bundle protein n=1 Tax=Pricia mediterranea TaxID=3076079 RepID=A0ABU3L7I4_9FLAO|nr:hypothetical protein [Pricia sp. S334]MDT7829715.1 hypothetical protein [Pricia sp. S334]
MTYSNSGSLHVYKKALELCSISRAIASYVAVNQNLLKLYQSNSHRDSIADSLLTDATLIPEQIALAERTDCRAERMKIATYIHIMTRNINSYCRGLEKDGVKEVEYLDLLRQEIKSFRKSFKKWRKSLSGE